MPLTRTPYLCFYFQPLPPLAATVATVVVTMVTIASGKRRQSAKGFQFKLLPALALWVAGQREAEG